jgi:hypothetical protein
MWPKSITVPFGFATFSAGVIAQLTLHIPPRSPQCLEESSARRILPLQSPG